MQKFSTELTRSLQRVHSDFQPTAIQGCHKMRKRDSFYHLTRQKRDLFTIIAIKSNKMVHILKKARYTIVNLTIPYKNK